MLHREAQEPAHPRRLDEDLAGEDSLQLILDRARRQRGWTVAFLYHGTNGKSSFQCTRDAGAPKPWETGVNKYATIRVHDDSRIRAARPLGGRRPPRHAA